MVCVHIIAKLSKMFSSLEFQVCSKQRTKVKIVVDQTKIIFLQHSVTRKWLAAEIVQNWYNIIQ